MSAHTIDLTDILTTTDCFEGDASAWSPLEVELEVRWHPAEPDVGIFSKQPEVTKIAYNFDGEWFDSEDDAAKAIVALLGFEIDEDQDGVAAAIRKAVDQIEEGLEDD